MKRVGILLSGGVDSALIAKLVSELAVEKGIEVTAYTIGVQGAEDLDYAVELAQELGLNHKVRRLSISDVESYVSPVVNAVEERDLVQIEAGIGVYAAIETATRDGMRVIFSGQGPDELWGGYTWYPAVISREGYSGFQQRMSDDLARSDIETFDRENKIALAHGAEQLFPYVDSEIVKLAMRVLPQVKVASDKDTVGKRPHREVAKKLGLQKKYADRGKNAAQHGTGVHDILDAVACKKLFTPEFVTDVGYSSAEVKGETLASSTRYGYKFAEKDLWQVPEHIQFYLDSVAYKNNLLNEDERVKIRRFLQKAGLLNN